MDSRGIHQASRDEDPTPARLSKRFFGRQLHVCLIVALSMIEDSHEVRRVRETTRVPQNGTKSPGHCLYKLGGVEAVRFCVE